MGHTRYEMFRGREVDGQLAYLRLCGYAFQREGELYFRLSLFLYPQATYYLSKNEGSGYTIFAKAVPQADGRVVFQNPVGFARVMDHIRTHLYVRFPDLASHMYMSLFPLEPATA